MNFKIAAFFAVVIASTFATNASATTLERLYIDKLNRAKNAAAIDHLNSDYQQLHVLRLACRLQIEARQIPARCYEVLSLETKWELRPPRETAALRRQLDERCQRAAAALRLPPTDSSLGSLSPSCRHDMVRARAMQAYRQQGDAKWPGI